MQNQFFVVVVDFVLFTPLPQFFTSHGARALRSSPGLSTYSMMAIGAQSPIFYCRCEGLWCTRHCAPYFRGPSSGKSFDTASFVVKYASAIWHADHPGSRFANVTIWSATRRSSLALGTVVLILSNYGSRTSPDSSASPCGASSAALASCS